ncbi:unnamed protein product [Mytilus coruscus]|uniref:Mutator-like transposase domain-containing protein n=1 Tax=Mytilus coruscus TaxID=42192 RepID=A0A6J8D9J9_MYTCO|nr:unnamed protein product [Mytilus coruscus]
MKQQRQIVRQALERSGFPTDTPIPAECDTRYNNPLFGSRTRTPFQPGTQATTTIVENVTARKKIIDVHDANKLCKTASFLRSTGENAICPGHQGHYQLAEDEQPLVIGQLTTDGDSHAYRGFSKKHSEVVNLTPENLRDPRHLVSTQLRSIDKADFSEFMFPRRTKADHEKIHRRFSLDLTNRCTVEYNFAFKEAAGELERHVNRLIYVAD